ncbi:methionine synthase reductase isoform X2 [Bactrocera neohumeralis]|uniref:methionine synthase reductase isoform X2 n=1 Tax=Bactrocera neohumeralis TaxID=98809 RepID=UPI002165517D|nr:methionine synthase reductase isoform X2 [Bactrocera neohumeralis]
MPSKHIRNMVCPSDSTASGFDILNIKDYILEKYVPPKLSDPIYSVVFVDGIVENKLTFKHSQLRCTELVWPFSRTGAVPMQVPIKAAQILAEADDELKGKRILEITLDMQTAEDYFQPGDTIGILPINNIKDVQLLLKHMQLTNNIEDIFQLLISTKCSKKTAKLPTYIPTHCKPYRLLRDCLNIHAIPKKQFLNVLANCCENNDERAFLCTLSSKEGSSYYNELILERGLKLLELLELCPSCKPTLEVLIEHLPRLLPRPYSIANSPVGNDLKLIFSILPEKPGVTTDMLNNLATSLLNTANPSELPKITMYARLPNQFRFTSQEANERNHILIGVGTALAPFLGFLELKEQLLANATFKTLGDTWLFAGAINETHLPCRERILAYKEAGVLQRYFESFSRVLSASFHYVQEQLLAHASEFVEFLMQENTVLYICADGGSISKSIEKAIMECLVQVKHITLDEASQELKLFKGNGKYREDLWL